MSLEAGLEAGIVFCLSQSAIFSRMNPALFSISQLRLEVEAFSGNKETEKTPVSILNADGFLRSAI